MWRRRPRHSVAPQSGTVSGPLSFDYSTLRRHRVGRRRQHLGSLFTFQPAEVSAEGPLGGRQEDISSVSLRWWCGAALQAPRERCLPKEPSTTAAQSPVTTKADDDVIPASHHRSRSHPDLSDAPMGRLRLATASLLSTQRSDFLQ